MPTVDFTIDDLKKVFATKDDLLATKGELRELIEASELRIVKTVKETFDEYDKKLGVQRRVIRKHSADIAELMAAQG